MANSTVVTQTQLAITYFLKPPLRNHPLRKSQNHTVEDSLRGSSVKIGTMQRILAWPLRKDDTHTSRSANGFYLPRAEPRCGGHAVALPRPRPVLSPRHHELRVPAARFRRPAPPGASRGVHGTSLSLSIYIYREREICMYT